MRLYFTVPDTLQTQNGTLVRNFLRQCAVSTELARAVKFQGGGFFADGASVLANRRVYPGQVLSFDLPPEAGGVAPQPDIAVQVVYEDAFAVVLEKPPHLAVHPTLNYPGGTLASGKVVPMETTVAPMSSSGRWNRRASAEAPSTNQSPPLIRNSRPTINSSTGISISDSSVKNDE